MVDTFHKEIYCPKIDRLYYNEACLVVENVLNETIHLQRAFGLCYKCSHKLWTNILPLQTVSLLVPIFTVTSIQYIHEDIQLPSCVVSYHFEQHGKYKYVIDFSCDYIHVLEPPDYNFTSFLIFAVVLMTLWVLYLLLTHLNVRKHMMATLTPWLRRARRSVPSVPDVTRKIVYDEETNKETVVELVSRGTNTVGSPDEYDWEVKPLLFVEFEALLVLRGLTVTLWVYLFVEHFTFSFLRRSAWDGLKLNDIPIGWVYWVLAASVYLHLHHSLRLGESRRRIQIRGVFLRSALYIAGGYIYNNINNTSPLDRDPMPPFLPLNYIRVFGIFQRVGLALVLTASVEVCFMKRQIKKGPMYQDLRDSLFQWLITLSLVVTHSAVTYLVPVKGCPFGYTGPGGNSNHALEQRCTGGVAGFIDRSLFSRKRLLPISALEGDFSVHDLKVPFDPEGLLGTLTTSVLMALAMQASRIFIYFDPPLSRVSRLAVWSVVQLLLGGVLCNFQTYNGLVPVNRYLMSMSYVLLVSGLAYFALLCCYAFINIWPLWSGFPFLYTGVNMLVVLVGCRLFQHTFPFQWQIPPEDMYTDYQFLLRAAFSVCVWTFICYYLLTQRFVFPV